MESSDYLVTTDKTHLDVQKIHDYLSNRSYWAKGIPLETVQRSIDNSVCFSVLTPQNEQVGFARVITDFATFAYLADVFILETHRGKGLSKLLMRYIMDYEPTKGLRRWMLGTHDAHELYAQFGWKPIENPSRIMQIAIENPYQAPDSE